MNIPHTRRAVRLQLPLTHPDEELNRTKVLPRDVALVLSELVAYDALKVRPCFGRFCSCCAETAAVEGEDGGADCHIGCICEMIRCVDLWKLLMAIVDLRCGKLFGGFRGRGWAMVASLRWAVRKFLQLGMFVGVGLGWQAAVGSEPETRNNVCSSDSVEDRLIES